MIDIASIVFSVAGKAAANELIKLFRGNKSELKKAYKDAFDNAVQWYETKYGDKYGTENNRFFNYEKTETELAKLLLLRPDPDFDLITNIKLAEGNLTPPEVVQEFVRKLREEMGNIRECEAVLVEREKIISIKRIESNVDFLPRIHNGIQELVTLEKQKRGDEKIKCFNEIEPDPKPINSQELERVFREEYHLDRLDYGHLGTTRENLEHKLELQKVYVKLNVKDRSFDRIMQVAKVNDLTIQQQQNLPLLFQRLDELLHLEHEKDQRIFTAEKENVEKASYPIAKKILEECNARFLRSASVIISEIVSKQRMKREQVYRHLWTLSGWAIVSRPLAEIPGKDRFFLIIGDAGSGKSTACRYMALRCFDDTKQETKGCLKQEFGITGKTPLPVYLRLEDFGNMIADYEDDACCLFECAAKFWQHANKTPLFTAGQFYYVLQNQPVWLFLDGLDEISNPANRIRLIEVVRNLVTSEVFPQLRITLTSRPAAITDELLNELDIPYYTMLNLENEQINDFAHNYFTANLPDETTGQVAQRAGELINALDKVPAAKQLATNPLLLTVIAVLHYKEDKLPHHRAELYEKCIEQLMAQKAATKGKLETGKISFVYPPNTFKPLINWSHTQIIDMLRDLAFFAHLRTENEVFLNKDLMLQRLKESDLIPPGKKTTNELEEAASYFLDECDRLIGLLAFRGGHYVFVHRTFQEYLAAHWLSMQKEADQQKYLLNMLENPSHWREAMRLFFNRLGKTNPHSGEELVQLLGERASKQQDEQLISLAAECLYDFEEYQKRYRLHGNVKDTLENLRDTKNLRSTIFLACGDALGKMNEPEIDVADPPMALLEPGKPFNMGSDEKESEKPIHPVQLSPFWIGAYQVTNKEFSEFIKQGGYSEGKYWFNDDSSFQFDGRKFLKGLKEKLPGYWLDERFGKNRPLAPVVGISWFEAMAYCRWWTLNFGKQWAEQHRQNSGTMRLPTEAEWEYACRAGTETPFYTGDNLTTEQANYNGNFPYNNYPKGKYLKKTTAIGSYSPNAWDLYDMHGNVWEWCLDKWHDNYKGAPRDGSAWETGKSSRRVLRGGSWCDFARSCRSADRGRSRPDYRSSIIGFRLVFVPQSVGG